MDVYGTYTVTRVFMGFTNQLITGGPHIVFLVDNKKKLGGGTIWVTISSMINFGISGSSTWRYVNVPYVWPYFLGIFPEI